MSSINREKVADKIVEKIKEDLLSGVLKEGDKLPNMTEYAKSLGVSRLSLREAMQTLEKMGAISSRPKVGTIIVCGDPSQWSYPILLNTFENPDLFQQLLEARMFFEGVLAAQCAIHIQPSDLRKMKNILNQQSRAFDNQDLSHFYKCDTQFHTLIATAASNIFMQRAYTELLQSTNPSITTVIRNIPGAVEDSLFMHRKIYQAILDKDSEHAEIHARAHLRRLLDYYSARAI